MSNPAHTIEIDRLVLTDLDVTPDRAERIRALVEAALQRQLERGGPPADLSDSEARCLEAQAIDLIEPGGDRGLADGLARSVARTIRGVGRER